MEEQQHPGNTWKVYWNTIEDQNATLMKVLEMQCLWWCVPRMKTSQSEDKDIGRRNFSYVTPSIWPHFFLSEICNIGSLEFDLEGFI